MKGGAPAFVIEFDTAIVSFDQFVTVLLTNTGQDETFVVLTLTPALGNYGDAQEVTVDLQAGETSSTVLYSIDSKGGNAAWLSISSMSDQVVPAATFYNYDLIEAARYLPGDFAIFNLLGGRTRLT